ncbi:hypothetical protein BpHYR1_033604 [Brachionus plicatilis]|uniref:Uncharacterized protein n=1 Tax=Brachionus plicatilis TaxID=10195 RepID=A0A3M7PM52_BRAPC|nr:hypothetical protein BpHYR1_033604 [Brachionus plicatilis]
MVDWPFRESTCGFINKYYKKYDFIDYLNGFDMYGKLLGDDIFRIFRILLGDPLLFWLSFFQTVQVTAKTTNTPTIANNF